MDSNQYAIELVTYLLVFIVYFYEFIVYMLLERNAFDSIAFFSQCTSIICFSALCFTNSEINNNLFRKIIFCNKYNKNLCTLSPSIESDWAKVCDVSCDEFFFRRMISKTIKSVQNSDF